ncbi:MAG: helix-turn-helix domain-containing protein [Lachnospiraceae bacterium]|nr:helix-turn-helix domain-containing protein [Lachnospiraceae bacterium]
MKQTVKINLDDTAKLALLGKALSVETRLDILKILCHQDMNINEIAEALSLPPSSAAAHIRVLEEAGLIKTTLQPGIRGSMKLCSKVLEQAELDLTSAYGAQERTEIIQMPIGNYVDYYVEPTCGLVGEKAPIGEEDEPRCFYHTERANAKLLWFGKGYVEYRFPNHFLKKIKERKVELSFEVCAEDHEYNLDWPSDITVWMNGIDAGTYHCPSDFGGRRGKLNPEWWPDKNTQYGELKTWTFTERGTFLDGKKLSETKLSEYALAQQEYISVRIGIKEDAKHPGGVNLFGDCFGDYEQNIKLVIFY